MYNEVLRKFFKYLVTESYAFIVHIASSAVASYVQVPQFRHSMLTLPARSTLIHNTKQSISIASRYAKVVLVFSLPCVQSDAVAVLT